MAVMNKNVPTNISAITSSSCLMTLYGYSSIRVILNNMNELLRAFNTIMDKTEDDPKTDQEGHEEYNVHNNKA